MGSVLTQRHRDTEVGDAARWPRVRLGDVCEIVAGQSPEGRFYTSDASFTEFHQGSKNFGEWELEVSGVYTSVVTKIVEAGTLLISVRAPVGDLNVTPRRICIGRGLAGLLPNAILDRDFLCYFLTAETKAVNEAAGAGSCFSSISVKQLASLSLPLPPLPVQHEIVARLERELGAVDKLAKKFEELESAAEAEFKAELKETFEEIKHRGTETRRLGDVCETISTRGHQIKQREIIESGRYPVVSQSENAIEGYTDAAIVITDLPLVLFGDHTCVVKLVDRPFVVGADGVKLLRVAHADHEYLFYWLQHVSMCLLDGEYRRHYSDLCEMMLPLPTHTAQREVVARLDAAKEKKEKLVAAARRGRETAALMRKAILKEAFE